MTDLMSMTARAGASREDVRRALTDAAEMRIWLADHAESELPERYAFWGDHVIEGAAAHQRPLDPEGHDLRFAWTLAGRETIVTVDLAEESATSTLITLTQTEFDLYDPGSLGMLQTFWALAIANLVDHLEGRPLTYRCDYTSSDLSGGMVIAATADQVYDSLIDPAKVSRWFGFPVEIEPKVGGKYGIGSIAALTPGRSLTVSWGPMGTTTFDIDESSGATTLTLVQGGFDESNPPYAAWAGTMCGMAEVRRLHELPDWNPIWQGEH
ncbi:SRPBCC domain-containing protein [Spongiactinospora sp. TRM90649]|uniref:SRPBCC domain-containing protein n=1 Tax=Spongiactinospora sp. TRM90649 TaxID=3031114 RepID=UPI0023F8F419|nr:SRPBCC domain-containing protein [Spongiactinospora sp. TRM90649]MDF5753651.1 SRPBCC domain-containing protein [Spongiactinospora sp. TRM90649]